MEKHVYTSKEPDHNGYIYWTDSENSTWATLVRRQTEIIKNVACDKYIDGLKRLDLPRDFIPQLADVNLILDRYSGWGVTPVDAIIQPEEFFTLLTQKRFPAATFIRIPEEINYIREPDIFHEIFGHAPLLTNQAYADCMEKFGHIALSIKPEDRRHLFRLFWFTVEFGLMHSDQGIRAYGGGILSSIGETQYCLTEKSIKKPFDVLSCLRTPYRVDIMQPLYYVIESFEQLYLMLNNDINHLIQMAKTLGNFTPLYPPSKKNEIDGVMPC